MKKIIYTYPAYLSFVRNDESVLKKSFDVKSFHFNQTTPRIAISFFRQFFFLIRHIRTTNAFVSFFAGYSSYLPGLFAKIFRKPHFIILGGTDCSSFPSIDYGNFRKKILGWFTCRSLKMATHLLPVSASLIDTEYQYTDQDFPRQGFRNFCKGVNAKIETIHLGYDSEKFFRTTEKIRNSFLTVSQLNAANYYRKGIDLIFEIAPAFPQSTFTIIGNTPEMKFENVPVNVKLLPFVPYDELKNYYSRSEFYLQLSIMEGFPSAVCEAMLCECIPIVSAVGAMPEIVGDTGYVLKKKDETGLVVLIKKALNEFSDEKGLLARNRIISEFPLTVRKQLVDYISVEIK